MALKGLTKASLDKNKDQEIDNFITGAKRAM